MDARQLWSAYGTQLLRLTLPAFDPASQRVAFGSVALVADLANRIPAIANESVFRFGDTVPAWSSAWTVRSSVAGEYGLFLDHAAAAKSDPALNAARQRLQEAENALQSTSYNMPVAAGTTAMTTFAPAFTLPGFAATYANWLKRAGGPPAATIHVEESAPGGGGQAILPFLNGATSGTSRIASPPPAAPADALFDVDDLPPFFSVEADPDEVNVAADASIEGSLQWTTSSLTVTFAGLDAVPIAAGSWFDPTLLQRFRDAVPPAPPFFGPQGSFALLPTHVILGYGGTLDLQLDTITFHATAELLLERATPVRFAPFLIGEHADAVAPSAAAELDDQSQTIRIRDLGSGLPLMLAVVSQIL